MSAPRQKSYLPSSHYTSQSPVSGLIPNCFPQALVHLLSSLLPFQHQSFVSFLAWFYSRVSSLGGQTKNPSHLTSPLTWAVSSLLQGFSGRGSKANPASICSLHVLPQHVLKSTLHSPYKPSPNSICTSSSSSRPDQALYNHDVHHLFFHFWATESASQQLWCLGLSPKGEDILRPLSKPT